LRGRGLRVEVPLINHKEHEGHEEGSTLVLLWEQPVLDLNVRLHPKSYVPRRITQPLQLRTLDCYGHKRDACGPR
jgi:hypothetical protein